MEAHVYRRKGEFYACSVSTTVDGLGVIGPPCLTSPRSVTDAELGAMALEALDGAQVDIPRIPRDQREARLAALLELAGVTSMSTFDRGAEMVIVERSDGGLVVTPTSKRDGSFYSDEDAAVRVVADDAALGAAIRAAFGDG